MNCIHLEHGDAEKGLPEKIYGTGTCLYPEKAPYLRVSTEAIGARKSGAGWPRTARGQG